MFDILMHLFGPPIDKRVDFNNGVSRMGGRIYAASADISWALSLQREDADRRTALKLPCRAIKVENKVFNLDSGFTDLHTRVYEETLAGNGWTLEDARPSVRLCEWIRDEEPVTRHLGTHPLVQVWQGPFNPGQGN
jgi:UDP-N-acetyl-2-amino-2-deoxyglucuronate dehydrogenase